MTKQQFSCKQCRAHIPTGQVDQAQEIAVCAHCQTVHRLKDSYRSAQELATLPVSLQPKGLTLKRTAHGLTIIQPWFQAAHVFVAAVALLINVGLLTLIQDPGIWYYLLCPVSWMALYFGYRSLAGLINKTVITVTPTQLTVRSEPLPYLRRQQLENSAIKQLSVLEKFSRPAQRGARSYDVLLLFHFY